MEDQVEAPVAPVETAPPAANDPFSLDENSLASLSPEQRASLDPIFTNWKQKAMDEITKRESSVSEKFKPYQDKASALDKLTQYQPFVQWWNEQQKAQASPASTNQTGPQIATPEEWQTAMYEASQGDGSKLASLQQKLMTQWAAPFVSQLQEKQNKIDTQLELKDLFESHPDAKDLDSIGLDPKTKEGTSLLEMALDWSERNGKSLEDGYQMAKRWADGFKVGAQQEAMGMVNDKKRGVTEGPSTSSKNVNVVEVESQDELIKKSMQAQMDGQKDVRFVLKGSKR